MSKILVTYWSGTGNTEQMAQLISEGAKAAGAEVEIKTISEINVDAALGYDLIAIGSPSMGQEVVEENEVEPFVEELGGKVSGRKVALFGSYDWGDGEWMRTWAERMRGYGANLMDDGLIVHLTPEGDAIEECKQFGAKAAGF